MPFLALRSSTRRGTVALIAVCGTAITLLTWYYAHHKESERIAIEFQRRAQAQASLAHEKLRLYQEMVYSLRDSFLGQNTVTRSEFAAVARELLRRHDGVQALQWLQIVPQAARADSEQRVTQALGRPFAFQRRNPDGTLAVAGPAEEYIVILYTEPLAGNELVLGLDVSSAPTAPFITAARDERILKVSHSFQLTQAADNQPGVVFILPVIQNPTADSPVLGFVQGVFKVQTMLSQSHLIGNNEALHSYYLDLPSGGTAPTLLYTNLAGQEPMRLGRPVALPLLDNPEDYHGIIRLGGRQWHLVIQMDPAWARAQMTAQPELMLAVGLAFTALLALFVNSLLQRTAGIEREVAQRTAELRNSEARLQAILDHNPNAIFVKNLEGCYLLVNQQYSQVWNRPVTEIIGRTDADLFPAEIAAQYQLSDQRILATGGVIRFEDAINRPGHAGPIITIVQKFPLYDADNKIYGICGIATDITDRKLAEAEKLAFERNLLETQKLESLGVLAGGIAHDFNNILTAVLGNASLARHILARDDASQVHLEQIEKAARRAADLCSQMLAYAGKGKLTMGLTNLSDLVRDTTSLLEVSVGKNCALVLRLADDLPPVLADATQLRQIVMNLVINGAEAIGSRSDGQITVTTFARLMTPPQFSTAIHQPKLPGGPYVGLEVRDNGSGLPPATLARIFEPFFTTKFSGRGLGLSAVLGVAQSHQGALFVESQPGSGATFRLLLPAAEGVAVTSAAPFPPSDDPAKLHGTVLVIDDESSIRNITTAALQAHGATVLSAASGEEGLALFTDRQAQIMLILLDMSMPGLSGEETLRHLRQMNARLPVIMMSGYSESETMARCESLGVSHFIHKPFELATLLAVIRDCLR